jgi:type IV secretion system protein TrbI
MSAPAPFDEQAKALQIRGRPRPVARLSRKVLFGAAGLGALALFAAASLALAPPRPVTPTEAAEILTLNTRKPPGLTALPATYDAAPAPKLGPPMPGDLGATILETERRYGIDADYSDVFTGDFRPSPEADAARARKLREAALAEDAARAPLFFRLEETSQVPGPPAMPGAASDPSFSLTSELLALTRAPQAGALAPVALADPNLQAQKSAFATSPPSGAVRNPGMVEDPLSPYQLMAGSLVPASLITGINSDLPGPVVAQVSQNVYDTVRGQYLLIPQGSRLIGRYQSEVSYGQDRALIVWDRILFPDGASVTISAPASDVSGYAGLRDRTDHHRGRVLAAAGLATLLGIGAELGPDEGNDIERAIRRGTTDTVSAAGQRAVDRSLAIQPSITIRPGWPVRIIVTRDLLLRPYEETAP